MRCLAMRSKWVAMLVLTAFPMLAQNDVPVSGSRQEFVRKLVAAAVERTHHTVRYDPAYVAIPARGGDVPVDTGVCIDEIIRVYRAVGHDDMAQNFSAYPN